MAVEVAADLPFGTPAPGMFLNVILKCQNQPANLSPFAGRLDPVLCGPILSTASNGWLVGTPLGWSLSSNAHMSFSKVHSTAVHIAEWSVSPPSLGHDSNVTSMLSMITMSPDGEVIELATRTIWEILWIFEV